MSNIENYVKAYEAYHGRKPMLVEKGRWVYVGKVGPFCKSKLPQMAKNLIDRKRGRDDG